MTDKLFDKIKGFLPPAPTLLTFLLVYAVLFVTANPLFSDPDAAWHIVAGDTILKLGHVPTTNLWSFATPNENWYLISWLWDLLVSFIHSLGGTKAVFVFTQLLVAFIMSLLAWHMGKRGGISSVVIVIILVLAGICFHKFAMSRPQLAGYLFIVICQILMHESRSDRGFRHLLWLPLIVILWINVHGSFLAVFPLFAAYMMEAFWQRQWRWLGRIIAVVTVSVLLMPIANPYGLELYDGVVRTMYSLMNERIEDWMPFVFGEYFGLSLWLVLFVFLSNFREPKAPLADKLLCIIFFIPMLESKRHTSIFILVSAPYLAINLQYFVDYAKRWRDIIMKYIPLHLPKLPDLRVAISLMIMATISTSIVFTDDLRFASYLVYPSFDSRPAIAWVHDHLAGKRVMTDYNFGGMIIYQYGGDMPVFVDGRAGSAYSEKFLAEYESFEQFYRNWPDVLEKYNIDAILFANSRPFVLLSEGGARFENWEMVYRDEVATVFVRKPN